MTTTIRLVTALAAVLGLAAVAGATSHDKQLTTTLRKVVEDNVSAYNAKDVDGVMRGIHTRSPEYASTKAAIEEQFRTVPATAQLVDFRFIGHDDEFAIARMKLKIAGPPTSDFQDDVVDSVMLFHQENGTWKLWTDEVLGVEFVEFVPTK